MKGLGRCWVCTESWCLSEWIMGGGGTYKHLLQGWGWEWGLSPSPSMV